MAEREYYRLTRPHSRTGLAIAVASRTSLWLGKDHLLRIDSNGYTENYKRFYFRDIQAIMMRQTDRRFRWNMVFGSLILFFTAIAAATLPLLKPGQWTDGAIAGGMILGGLLLLLVAALTINSLRGPACSSWLRTAVHTEPLPSLCRVRQARRVLDRLRPFIVAAQGELTPQEAAERIQGSLHAAPSMSAPPPVSSETPSPPFIVDDPNAPPRVAS